MATPITASTFRSIVENQLSQIFDEEYAKYNKETYGTDYEIRVDFDGDTRGSAQTLHTTSSGSNGSN